MKSERKSVAKLCVKDKIVLIKDWSKELWGLKQLITIHDDKTDNLIKWKI